MKKSNWLDITEYVLLAGSGVGAAVAIASKQLAFTAAPVSLLLMVNFLNRRRADQAVVVRSQERITLVEQHFSKQIEAIDRRLQGLPTFWDLASLRKTVLQKNRLATTQVQQQLSDRLAVLEQRDSPTDLQVQIHHLKEQQARMQTVLTVAETNLNRIVGDDRMRTAETELQVLKSQMDKVQGQINKFSRTLTPSALKTLQSQIDHLNRRFTALPNPVDTDRLQQEMQEVLKVINDMASRREMQRLLEEIVQIRTQQERLEANVAPLRLVTKLVRRQVATLEGVMRDNHLIGERVEVGSIAELKATIAALEQRIQHLPAEVDFVQLRSEVFGRLDSQADAFHQQIRGVQQSTQDLGQQQQMMENWIKRLPEFLDFSALRNQMKYLGDRIDGYGSRLDQVDVQLAQLQPGEHQPQYELLFDLPQAAGTKSNRALLASALKTANERITMVFPHPDKSVFDQDLIAQMRAFLDRGGKLDLGWGYLSNLDQDLPPRYIQAKQSALTANQGFLKKVLTQLNELRQHYPRQFRFKVLGTDDSFLVCDHDYAILGSHVNLQSQLFPRLLVGLRTNHSQVIARLLERFEQPVLNEDDDQAYFKRAVTRSELDEPEGAIADYTRVIQINPKHDIAYNNRGLLRYQMGNREGAIADFNRAILVNPSNSIAYCNRGVVRSEMGNLMGAVEDFSGAVQVSPSCAPAFFQRGLARMHMGNNMGAAEDFSDVIRLDAHDASAFYYRGLARTKLGDRIAAIRDLKEAGCLFLAHGNSAGHQQALAAINQLQKSMLIEGSSTGDSASDADDAATGAADIASGAGDVAVERN
jgi:tetratricopeptide (TPR) repeat protein